jgi:hypothetical protein
MGNYTMNLAVTYHCSSGTLIREGYIEVQSCLGLVADYTANLMAGILPLTVQFNHTTAKLPSASNPDKVTGFTPKNRVISQQEGTCRFYRPSSLIRGRMSWPIRLRG